ncbi:hypothetical protein ACFQY7_55500 [Actinomadura luteofluorescens]|uniref:hypothetical protein n=1 Tax=Actinomadura luteofluorescens TaxID=46163 RepID=UPI0036329734
MTRANVVRAVLAFAVLATSFYFAWSKPARLGLDLRGGTQIVLETQDSPAVKAAGSPPTAPARCCTGASTRSGSPSRPSPGPATGG